MARRVSRAFPAGLVLIAAGVVMIGLGAVLDHYDMTRAEWYFGEPGIYVLGAGSLISLVAVLGVLFGDGGRDDTRPAAGGDGGGDV